MTLYIFRNISRNKDSSNWNLQLVQFRFIDFEVNLFENPHMQKLYFALSIYFSIKNHFFPMILWLRILYIYKIFLLRFLLINSPLLPFLPGFHNLPQLFLFQERGHWWYLQIIRHHPLKILVYCYCVKLLLKQHLQACQDHLV